jgi:hypothetical protein
MATEKLLAVPYLVQPTSNTCQSTCLKMFGLYLARRNLVSSPVEGKRIIDIWEEINAGTERPSKARNSYANMKWWLERYFPRERWYVRSTKNMEEAIAWIVRSVDAGYPVIVSTNHSRTDGHIILIIGYQSYTPNQCSADLRLVCHDPYGKFGPQLKSKDYGKRRYAGGMSLVEGGETGPGKAVLYDSNGIRRIRTDKHSSGTFFLISAE